MTMEQMAFEKRELTVAQHTGRETLQECVRQSLVHYFTHLGDHTPADVYQLVLAEVEQPLLETVMEQAGGNQTRAAAMLGISRGTLRKKLERYRLD
jgi:Fis family transcriptional regulator